MSENDKDVKSFKDFTWRLNLVTACRARQKIMVPKYTVKLDLDSNASGSVGENGEKGDSNKGESYVLDVDYTNLKRI